VSEKNNLICRTVYVRNKNSEKVGFNLHINKPVQQNILELIFSMLQKVSKILVITAVVLGISSGGICEALPSLVVKNPCEKSCIFGHIRSEGRANSCHIKPCLGKTARLLILPDSSSRQQRPERYDDFSAPGLKIDKTELSPLCVLSGRAISKLPLYYIPPPLFSLNCSLIC